MVTIDMNNPRCLTCNKELGTAKSTAKSLLGTARVATIGLQSVQELRNDYTLFLGSVCFKCKTVFCMECNHRVPHTCPRCQGETEPAYRKHLHELSALL